MLERTECGGLIAIQIVAAIALVEIGRRCKLALVRILMAIRASSKPQLELSLLTLLDVTLAASYSGVFADKRIRSLRMLRNIIRRLRKATLVMTALAVSTGHLFAKLPEVRVAVAINTKAELRQPLQRIILMARLATDVRMFA